MKAVLVDMEGVIRDSRNAFHHAYERSLSTVGVKLNAYPAETWKLRGYAEFNSQRNFLKALYSINKGGEDLTRVFWKKYPVKHVNDLIKKNGPNRETLDKIEQEYMRFIMTPVVLRRIPPVRAGKIGVKLLKEDGYPVGVVTNAKAEYNTKWMEQKKVQDHFHSVVTSDEGGLPKPAPDMVLKGCDKIGHQPKHVVYLGDSEADIMAAKAAGCIPIGIMSGSSERTRLKELGATHVFDSVTDFALYLRRGGKI